MKKGVLAGLVCALLFGIFSLVRTGSEPDTDVRVHGGSFLEDITIVQKKKGLTVWTLKSEKAVFGDSGKRAELQTVRLAFPQNNLMLFADSGTYDFSQKSFSADTAVEAEGQDYRIRADSLDLDVSSAVIRTEGRVHLVGKGFSLEGEGMKAGKEPRVKIFRDVKAIFQN